MNKRHIYIVVEGQTEEKALKELLEEHLKNFGATMQCILIGERNKHSGGGKFNLSEFEKLLKHLVKTQSCIITTFFDYYALANSWPDVKKIRKMQSDAYAKVTRLEETLQQHVETLGVAGFNSEWYFLSYVQMHEFETLLFSHPEYVAEVFSSSLPCQTAKVNYTSQKHKTMQNDKKKELLKNMQLILKNASNNCELINDNYDTCPSKRLEKLTEGRYRKGKSDFAQAPLILRRCSLKSIRSKCRHFDAWLKKLEDMIKA